MISDVLFEAVEAMDKYLNDPIYQDTYSGDLREELLALREKIDSMRARLDAPP